MRKLVLIVFAVVLGVGIGFQVVQATDAPADGLKATNYGKKAPVVFDHSKHGDTSCDTCHHKAAEGKYKCGDCHKLTADKAPKIADAMHKKDTGKCWNCHRAKDAKAKKKCNECHLK